MRKFITGFFVCLSSLTYSQNYKLFNASSKKLFTDSVNTFSIAFDSVVLNNSDSLYYNFCYLNDTTVPVDSCSFWGPPDCIRQDKPVWLGRKVVDSNSGKYYFFTGKGDTLFFDLAITLGDTSVFFIDTLQRFSVIYKNVDTMSVLGYLDSVRSYKILHTDLAGNPVSSALSGQNILVGKSLGLTRFFHIDSFPAVLKPLDLLGNTFPNAGLFHITKGMIYDYQPGDEIQFRNWAFYSGGPPWGNYDRYIMYRFLNRVETSDSIIYTVQRTSYDVYSWTSTVDTVSLSYYKHEVIAEIPFEYFDGYYNKLFIGTYCGLTLPSFSSNEAMAIGYCLADDCWGPVDTNGPPAISSVTYVLGLGMYASGLEKTAPPPTGYWKGTRIVYFKKDGVVCDTQIVMGLDSQPQFEKQIVIKPNPARDNVEIFSPVSLGSVTLFDIQGRKLLFEQIETVEKTISVSGLAPGIYLLHLQTQHGMVVRKIIKE